MVAIQLDLPPLIPPMVAMVQPWQPPRVNGEPRLQQTLKARAADTASLAQGKVGTAQRLGVDGCLVMKLMKLRN